MGTLTVWVAPVPALRADDLRCRHRTPGDAPDRFEALGHHLELIGGHIRNAIFKVAISAAEAASSVSKRHLVEAANIEYRAIGKIVRA